jgi:hypothetical protein
LGRASIKEDSSSFMRGDANSGVPPRYRHIQRT